jgi:hypothetical protein
MRLTVEQALHQVADKIAFLRDVTDIAASSDVRPPPEALSGLADICADLDEMLRDIRSTLTQDCLDLELADRSTDD